MRILRLTALRSYLILSKNIKKSLVAINIGIFLCIFAGTAAVISIYIENKINKEEFILVESQQAKIESALWIQQIPVWVDRIDQAILLADSFQKKNNFLISTDLGNKLISMQDMYLSFLYELEMINEFMPLLTEFNNIIKEDMSLHPHSYSEEALKEFKILISKGEKYIENPLTDENSKKYEKRIFHSSYSDLKEEILYANKHLKGAEDYFYESKLLNEYRETYKFMLFFKEYFLMIEYFGRSWSKAYDDNIQIQNNEILKLSTTEKNLIFSAFILQLIIFIIIQFFEISSVATQKLKKRIKK